jgi:hypothetical protein
MQDSSARQVRFIPIGKFYYASGKLFVWEEVFETSGEGNRNGEYSQHPQLSAGPAIQPSNNLAIIIEGLTQ